MLCQCHAVLVVELSILWGLVRPTKVLLLGSAEARGPRHAGVAGRSRWGIRGRVGDKGESEALTSYTPATAWIPCWSGLAIISSSVGWAAGRVLEGDTCALTKVDAAENPLDTPPRKPFTRDPHDVCAGAIGVSGSLTVVSPP